MRFFPRTLRRRLGATLVASALALGALAIPLSQHDSANADDGLKDKQKHVQRQLHAAANDLEESSAAARRTAQRLEAARQQLVSAKAALVSARARLAAARARDREMQRRLEEAVARLKTAQADVAAGQADVAAQRDSIATLIADIYQQGDPQLLAFTALLNAESASDLTREAEAQDVIVGTQTQAYDELRATEVLLTVREQQVADAKAETAQRRAEAADLLAARQALAQEAADAEAAVRASVRESRNAKAQAERVRAADRRRLAELRAEEDRIAAMLRRRAAAAANGHSGAPQASGGYLNYPVNGPITSPFGYRIHPIYGYWGLHDGTDFGVSCGEPLYSAAPGKVVSSYWSTVYGNRLIIDNGYARGVGLATIYNHAVRYTVGVGDHVGRGEVIGYVGSTGWSTGCHLHFTVMVNGRAVDPENWL